MSKDKIQNDIILIIKDASKNLLKLSNTLRYSDFTVLEASDLKSAFAIAEGVKPHLILIDMRVSGEDEWKISHKLKSSSQTKDILLIFMGASQDTINKIKLYQWQAVKYFSPSASLKEVVNLIKANLKSQRNKRKKELKTNNFDTEKQLILAKNRLQKANRDLEDFVSIVSQDLQAPLRSLNMSVELLAQEYEAELDVEASKYLEQINNSGSQMQILLQDLLSYSRAGKGVETWVSVELETVLNQVIQDLQSSIKQTQAVVIVEDLPQVFINATEIRQLFKNLIENAIQFRSDKKPEIRIEAQQYQEEWLIMVKDNGMGIEPKFQEQIFQVFQRINPSDIYPGTGIGLAICHKIVQRYGGKIWVESELGSGATFYFTLPTEFSCKKQLAAASEQFSS